MAKLVSVTLLKKGLNDLPAGRVTLLNVEKIKDLKTVTLVVNGSSVAGTRIAYDTNSRNKGFVDSLFVSTARATIKTAMEVLGAKEITTVDVTVVPVTGSNFTKSIPIANFLYQFDHPSAAGDSELEILASDGHATEFYRIDETRAVVLAAANA